MKVLFLLAAFPLLGIAQSWIPYTAQYTETSSNRNTSGKEQVTKRVFHEVRSGDGSIARSEEQNGSIISKTLWLSCGDIVTLDYANKTAHVSTKHPPRTHIKPPQKEKALGVATIAGVNATAWPIRVPGGGGTAWIDSTDDIIVKLEMHSGNASSSNSYVKEMTSLDLTSPVDESTMKAPKGFSIEGGAATCAVN